MIQTTHVIHLPRPSRLLGHISSRRRPLDIELETVYDILGQYGLELSEPPRNLPVGRRNRNLDVYTSAGRKMLKGYRSQWQEGTVRYAHSILNRLAELDFPAPRLVAAGNGEDFVRHGGQYYALFDFMAGTNYTANFLLRSHRLKLMALAGQTLASFHRQLTGFQPAGTHHMGFGTYTGGRWRDVAWHVGKIKELKEKSRRVTGVQEKSHLNWLMQNSNDILDEIEQLDEVLAQAPLPRLVIHGDYGLHNLLFQKNGTVGIVDYELARLEWRLSDLVSCLSRYRYSKVGQIAYDVESIQWFMAAYQAEYPLSPDEWQLLPLVWRFYKMQSAVQYWNSYFQTDGPIRKLISARDAIDQVDWVRNYPHKLIALNTRPVPSFALG